MKPDPVQALGLPRRALVRERLSKKLLLDMAAETTSDRRLVTSAVGRATVEAVLTPTTTGIAEHRGSVRRVQDIAVISIDVPSPLGNKDQTRLLDIVHRSMPRPVVVLLPEPDGAATISVALTRISQTDNARSVVEAAIIGALSSLPPGALSLSRLDRTDLWAYYQDLAKTIATAGSGGVPSLDAVQAITERRRLDGLEADLATVTRNAQREKSLQKRIDLNARAGALRVEIEEVKSHLYAHTSSSSTSAQPEAGS